MVTELFDCVTEVLDCCSMEIKNVTRVVC